MSEPASRAAHLRPIYIPLSEEPGLAARFGADDQTYRAIGGR